MKRFQTADAFYENAEQWQDALHKLRKILLAAGLEETVKWGGPCYTVDDKLVVGVGAFKSYCGLWFFQGALLEDQQGVLVNAQEGKTKAQRQWRFGAGDKIDTRQVKRYVKEAMALSRAGREIKPDRTRTVVVPALLKSALRDNPRAAANFKAMTKGKQREYAEYIDGAKRDETKLKRLEKILPMLEANVGLNDKYRNC